MAGAALLTFDCEGRWGVADRLTPRLAAGLTDARLRRAYAQVAGLLRAHDLRATFAVVELFVRPAGRETAELVAELARAQPYLAAAARGLAAGEPGWSGDWVPEMLGAAHEIAFHGATHVPWPRLTRQQAQRELALAPPERRSMVFPRNEIAHLDLLAGHGIAGYRGRRAAWRAAALASELAPALRSAPPPAAADAPVEIPAGMFVNWRHGLRALVPPAVTRRRARALLRHAARTGGVAHFWLHPENIATAPATLVNLQGVVAEIAALRDAGRIEVRTQLDHCRAALGSAPDGRRRP